MFGGVRNMLAAERPTHRIQLGAMQGAMLDAMQGAMLDTMLDAMQGAMLDAMLDAMQGAVLGACWVPCSREA